MTDSNRLMFGVLQVQSMLGPNLLRTYFKNVCSSLCSGALVDNLALFKSLPVVESMHNIATPKRISTYRLSIFQRPI